MWGQDDAQPRKPSIPCLIYNLVDPPIASLDLHPRLAQLDQIEGVKSDVARRVEKPSPSGFFCLDSHLQFPQRFAWPQASLILTDRQ